MPITPKAGYQIDPNNPNGVVPMSSATQIPQTAPNNAVVNAPTSQPINTSGQGIPSADLNSFGAANPGLAFTKEDLPSYNNAKPMGIVDTLNQGGQPSDYASRSKLAQTYGIQGYTGTADQNTQLLQKYKTGLATAQQSGKEAPATSGEGSQMVNDITGGKMPPAPEINPLDTVLAQDKGYQTLLADYKAYTDSTSQRTSLVDEYKKLQKDANLPELNAEAINMKNIMEGTETDIRNEITKAGGFATESQVLALTGARNKGLIQNYNKLVDTINNAQSNVNTLIGLSKEDRANADSQLKTQLDFDNQVMQYRDKMQNNAVEAYNKVIYKAGYAGLYSATGGDPHTIGLVEKTLGLAPGALQKLSTTPKEGDLQFVSGTDNQSSGYFNKTTGKFTPYGTTVGKNTGSGITGANLAYSGIIDTILGSGKFTKDQANAVRNAINNGEDPLTVVKNNAKNIMGQTEATKLSSLEASRDAFTAFTQSLNDFYNAGGDTSYISGSLEKIYNKLGQVKDPKLVQLATELQGNIQSYRNAISGTAYSEQEGKDIASIFPGINKSQTLNDAIVAGRKKLFDSSIDGLYRTALGSTYDKLKAASTVSPTSSLPSDVQTKLSSNLTFSSDGKTAYIPQSIWSTFGANMDAVLKEAQQEGFKLLVK